MLLSHENNRHRRKYGSLRYKNSRILRKSGDKRIEIEKKVAKRESVLDVHKECWTYKDKKFSQSVLSRQLRKNFKITNHYRYCSPFYPFLLYLKLVKSVSKQLFSSKNTSPSANARKKETFNTEFNGMPSLNFTFISTLCLDNVSRRSFYWEGK